MIQQLHFWAHMQRKRSQGLEEPPPLPCFSWTMISTAHDISLQKVSSFDRTKRIKVVHLVLKNNNSCCNKNSVSVENREMRGFENLEEDKCAMLNL